MKTYILTFVLAITSASSALASSNELYAKEHDKEAYCLAQNVYYEARSSNLADMAAVADVVLNRVNDTRYPNTVCDVVHDGPKLKNGVPKKNSCQFSWYCDGKSDKPENLDAWIKAQQIAYMMLYLDQFRGITEGATHYHATYVSPKWASSLQLVGRIGDHIYYRWAK